MEGRHPPPPILAWLTSLPLEGLWRFTHLSFRLRQENEGNRDQPHSLSYKYFVNTYYVPSTVLAAGDIKVTMTSLLRRSYIPMEVTDRNMIMWNGEDATRMQWQGAGVTQPEEFRKASKRRWCVGCLLKENEEFHKWNGGDTDPSALHFRSLLLGSQITLSVGDTTLSCWIYFNPEAQWESDYYRFSYSQH